MDTSIPDIQFTHNRWGRRNNLKQEQMELNTIHIGTDGSAVGQEDPTKSITTTAFPVTQQPELSTIPVTSPLLVHQSSENFNEVDNPPDDNEEKTWKWRLSTWLCFNLSPEQKTAVYGREDGICLDKFCNCCSWYVCCGWCPCCDDSKGGGSKPTNGGSKRGRAVSENVGGGCIYLCECLLECPEVVFACCALCLD